MDQPKRGPGRPRKKPSKKLPSSAAKLPVADGTPAVGAPGGDNTSATFNPNTGAVPASQQLSDLIASRRTTVVEEDDKANLPATRTLKHVRRTEADGWMIVAQDLPTADLRLWLDQQVRSPTH